MQHRRPLLWSLALAAVAAGATGWITLGAGDRVLAAGLAQLSPASLRWSTTMRVADMPQLYEALKLARGGETITLAPGVYSGLAFKAAPKFDKLVTITSANPSRRAVFSDFALTGAKGLRFTNLDLVPLPHDVAADGSYWAFKILRSEDVHFDRVSIHGSLDGDSTNDVQGLQLRFSTNLTVTNCEFQQLERALLISQTSKVVASGNYAHDLRSDGFDLVEVHDIRLIDNTFRDFTPIGDDHPDAIQFWTTGTKVASRDIVIADNVILRGSADYMQGIFLRDQVGTLPYERVTIRNNLVVGTGYNGIRIQGARDLTLTDNQLVSFEGDHKTFMLVQGADKVIASGNSASKIDFGDSTNVTQGRNTITKAVGDRGRGAMAKWVKANPQDASRHERAVLGGR